MITLKRVGGIGEIQYNWQTACLAHSLPGLDPQQHIWFLKPIRSDPRAVVSPVHSQVLSSPSLPPPKKESKNNCFSPYLIDSWVLLIWCIPHMVESFICKEFISSEDPKIVLCYLVLHVIILFKKKIRKPLFIYLKNLLYQFFFSCFICTRQFTLQLSWQAKLKSLTSSKLVEFC